METIANEDTSENGTTRTVGDKCDEVDSKTEASVEKEEAGHSVHNALFDEPISKDGTVEDNLPTSVPNVEPNVHDQTEEEGDKIDPKEEDEDKSIGEGDETQSTENRDVCSKTSEQNIADDSIRTQENEEVLCTYCEKVVPSRPDFNDHMAADHPDNGSIREVVQWFYS